MIRQLCARVLIIVAALAAVAVAGTAPEPIPLLDEDWDVELTWHDTTAEVVTAERAGGRVRSGEKALRVSSPRGAPQFRIKNAGSLRLDRAGSRPKLRLWYRAEKWTGRWSVQLHTYYRPLADRTFPIFKGVLDGAGPEGSLVADGKWHRAEAPLEATERARKIPGKVSLPLFLMFRPVGGGDSAHRALIDRVEVLPSAGGRPGAEAAEREPELTYFPKDRAEWFSGPEPRPMPHYDRGDARRLGPDDDLQAALDEAGPGDVFLLAPGVYRQRLKIEADGTAEAPIVLAAQQPGTVTLTGEPADFELTFEPTEHEGVFAAEVPWRVRAARAAGRELFAYDSVEHLLNRTSPTERNGEPRENLPPEGFTWQDGKLYVELSGGLDPRRVPMQVHRRYDEADQDMPNHEFWRSLPRAWHGDYMEKMAARGGTLLQVRGSHVRVGGLRLEMAPEIGLLASGDDVTVHDCYFVGTVNGIIARGAADLVVGHCEYTQYPFYRWLRWAEMETDSWNPWWGAPRKGVFLTHNGPRTRVRNNLLYGGHDLLRPRAHDSTDPEDMSEYAYNFVHSAWDECIEFDTAQALNLRVHHNVLMDAVVPLAISPVLEGPLLIDHNIEYVSPRHGVKSALLKFYMIPSWRRYNEPTQSVTIAHNTAVNSRFSLYWTGEDHFYRDNIIENNIFLVRFARKWDLPGLEVSPYNLYHGMRINRLDHLEHLIRDRMPGFVRPPDFDAERPPVIPLPSPDVPARAMASGRPRADFRLAEDSPAIDAGNPDTADRYGHTTRGEAPDLGAIEYGDAWQFPAPGPRWARDERTPWRPPLPPSLDPAWVGLD